MVVQPALPENVGHALCPSTPFVAVVSHFERLFARLSGRLRRSSGIRRQRGSCWSKSRGVANRWYRRAPREGEFALHFRVSLKRNWRFSTSAKKSMREQKKKLHGEESYREPLAYLTCSRALKSTKLPKKELPKASSPLFWKSCQRMSLFVKNSCLHKWAEKFKPKG